METSVTLERKARREKKDTSSLENKEMVSTRRGSVMPPTVFMVRWSAHSDMTIEITSVPFLQLTDTISQIPASGMSLRKTFAATEAGSRLQNQKAESGI